MTRKIADVAAKPPSTAVVDQTAPDATHDAPVDALMPKLADDLLRGAEQIATYLFGDPRHRRKVYHLTGEAKHGMPHFKIGSIICARRSTLLRWIAEQESRR